MFQPIPSKNTEPPSNGKFINPFLVKINHTQEMLSGMMFVFNYWYHIYINDNNKANVSSFTYNDFTFKKLI